jgi:hypothetical protein
MQSNREFICDKQGNITAARYGTRVSYSDPENHYKAPVVPKSDVRLHGFGGNTIENAILRWEESADLDRGYGGIGFT